MKIHILVLLIFMCKCVFEHGLRNIRINIVSLSSVLSLQVVDYYFVIHHISVLSYNESVCVFLS